MSANGDVWLRWLTLISLSIGILSGLGLFGVRILRSLDKLSELTEIKEEVQALTEQSAQQHVDNVRQMSTMQEQIRNSQQWHSDHLLREHGHRGPGGTRR